MAYKKVGEIWQKIPDDWSGIIGCIIIALILAAIF